MLSRFIALTRRSSGGDGRAVSLTAPAGVGARRTVPSTWIPLATSALRKAPAVNGAGSSTTSEYLRGTEREPIQPRATICPSRVRTTETLPPLLPGTVRTVLVSGNAVVDGSRTTRAGPLPLPG